MCGLKAAALLAYNQLVTTLNEFGVHPIPGTMGLWRHTTRPIHFFLRVDDVGVKYFNKEDINLFFNALNSKHKYSVDSQGTSYCGLHLDWNYEKKCVDISLLNYINTVLQRLPYKLFKHPKYSAHHLQT